MTSLMLVDANIKIYDHPITRRYGAEVKKSRYIGSQQLLVEFCVICERTWTVKVPITHTNTFSK